MHSMSTRAWRTAGPRGRRQNTQCFEVLHRGQDHLEFAAFVHRERVNRSQPLRGHGLVGVVIGDLPFGCQGHEEARVVTPRRTHGRDPVREVGNIAQIQESPSRCIMSTKPNEPSFTKTRSAFKRSTRVRSVMSISAPLSYRQSRGRPLRRVLAGTRRSTPGRHWKFQPSRTRLVAHSHTECLGELAGVRSSTPPPGNT